MSGWEITTTAIVGLVLVGVIIFSILRPSAHVKIGVFFERELEHNDGDESDDEQPRKAE